MEPAEEEETFTVEEWGEGHPRWPEFVRCLEETAPEQAPFVLGEYARRLPCHLLVALCGGRVAGFLRFGVQPLGPESGWPPLALHGAPLTEAKIHAFAVRPEDRRRGIGTALQMSAITRARALGCHQLASHSGAESAANHRVKLALGFSALPESHEGGRSIYFLMPLRAPGRGGAG
jgi:GNAT superfamily N-acetyltransferase